ncbi:hypothetical protein O3M35_013072 [Rhynocoris fuscipes]|uniref:DNA-directed RNA polymerase n=1 Tax=Rhynocoris fuscipes TaxID=488301 RepID=A0AAW1CHA8_9HEMI
MQRVFHLNNISLVKVYRINNKFMNLHQSRLTCSLCKTLFERRLAGHYNEIIQRDCSTNVSTLHFDKTIKKKKNKKRFYTELLEVSNDNANERRTKVKKINANNIIKLNGNSLNMSDEFSQESISSSNKLIVTNTNGIETLVNSKETAELPAEEVEEMVKSAYHNELIEDEVTIVHNETIKQNSVEKSFKQLGKEKEEPLRLNSKVREILSKTKYSELDKAGKERSLTSLLTAYIDVCNSSGFVNRGYAVLNNYLNNSSTKIEDVKVFDTLLSGYASQGNVDKFLEVWEMINNYNIKRSVQSYIYRIECIARSSKPNKDEMLNTTLRIMFSEGIPLNTLFIDTKWKNDTREVVLKAIRAVRQNFTPVVPKSDLYYSNPLVNHLNNIKHLNLKSPADDLLNTEELKILFNEQLKNEMELYVRVRSVDRPEVIDNVTLFRDKLNKLHAQWDKVILHAFQRDLSAMNSLHRSIRRSSYLLNIYPYLTVLDKNEYKEIIMNEVHKLAEGNDSFSLGITLLYKELGQKVRIRYENKLKSDEGLLKKLKGVYYEYGRWYLDERNGRFVNGRQKWKLLIDKFQSGPSIDFEIPPWPTSVLIGIGKFLYNIILRDIKINVNILRKNVDQEHLLPAFYTVYKTTNHIVKDEVKPHPLVARLYRGACLPMLTFNVAEVPMLIPPVPWNSLTSGGYLVAKTNLIRLANQAVLQWERLNNSPKSQIYPCLDSLNQLGSVPWKINQPVLDLVIKIFNEGGNPKLAIPEPVSAFIMPESEKPSMTKEEKYQAYRKRMIAKRKKAEMYSLWCDALYKLSLANHFRDKVFWLPHNMDFRGRVYPCPPHLNHLSSDMSRSILCFAKGEPLGTSGLDWLKIHVINLTGLKKRDSLSERLAYGNSIIDLIVDSANNPLDGKRWWMESEEPWQTLACCIEIRNALMCPEGPENYISHYPIHQDGSCNGLQHYAALGRDSAGAYSVNLSPCEKPQDVYSCVAAIVERERNKDALNGSNIAQVLEGFVRRKVIKQTVMTTVYGVTRFGARLQIAKQLKDIDDFPKQHIWQASTYLVTKTFESLREMFQSTREIQDWLAGSARLISHICGQNVEYVTPIGLPVVQPYIRVSKVSSYSKNFSPNAKARMDMFESPNTVKQRNAFPPNFIHSLDSTHMMLTSLHCEQAGITFVSVHDCFWTHPKNVHIMNRICREQFVALHSQPILSNLSEFLLKNYGYEDSDENFTDEMEKVTFAKKKLNSFLRNVPNTGDFKLSDVLGSVYFFS